MIDPTPFVITDCLLIASETGGITVYKDRVEIHNMLIAPKDYGDTDVTLKRLARRAKTWPRRYLYRKYQEAKVVAMAEHEVKLAALRDEIKWWRNK